MKKIMKILKVLVFIILGLIVLIIIASTINNRIGNCKVKGEIKGLGTTLALVNGGTDSYNQTFTKVILVFNNKFSFRAKLIEPGGIRLLSWNMLFKRASGESLWMRSKKIEFNMNPNQTILINGFIKDYAVNYLVSGNILAEQYSKFRQDNLPILERETLLYLKIDSAMFYGASQDLLDSLNKAFDNTRDEYNYERLRYAIQNPTHEISASFLQSQNKDSIIKYFPTLSENVLATYEGKILKERFLAYKTIAIGKEAPDFSGLTIKSEKFCLKDLRGKMVMLDFWGTWCGWCVKGLPKMQQYYNKYKDKIEFVSIACHDKPATWEAFVKEKDLKWIQLLNDEKNNDLSKKYAVENFPTKILIDQQGKIIEIFTEESDLFYNKLDELLKK
jgi:thiol-disulfide isomerase/thioredoxin